MQPLRASYEFYAGQLRLRRTGSSDAQCSLMRWAVPAGSLEEARAAAFRRREECLERRRERAESLVLPSGRKAVEGCQVGWITVLFDWR